jgi:hypothetical protein
MEKPTTLDLEIELFKTVQENKLAEVETLLAQRANPKVYSEDNFTLLHVAALQGHTALTELLLNNNADINTVSKRSGAYGTALHVATVKKNIPLIELLIRRGADLFIREPYFNGTVLHIAAYKNIRVIEPFIITPSLKIMLQAKLLAKECIFPLLCCFHRFAKGEGVGIAIPQNMQSNYLGI